MHDVIIVGAGPAGNLAARTLAEKKYEVIVLEEHESPGLPMHCTGFVSEETLRMSRVKPDIYSTIYGAEVTFPNGKSIEVRSDKPKGVMIDRVDLEVKMAEAAQKAGADYCFNERYQGHTVGDAVVVDTTVRPHRGKVLIGADGANSQVAMSLGDNRPNEYIRGIQVDVDYAMEDQEMLKLYLGNTVAPGFFAWAIPCGDFTRIGLCSSWSAGPPSEYLSDILVRMGFHDKVLKVYSGKIPLGIRPYLSGDRVLLTGDAAGFVKPLSGGGLYPTFKANAHLMTSITNGLDSDALYSRDLSEYSRNCMDDFGRELERSYQLRKRYKKLTDSDLNRIYDYIQKNDLIEYAKDIDIDHPADVVKKVLKVPSLLFSAIPLFMRSVR